MDYKKITNKVLKFIKGLITKLRSRYRFYISYKGSLFDLSKRRLYSMLNKPKFLKQNAQAEKEFILLEVARLRRKLEKAVRSL